MTSNNLTNERAVEMLPAAHQPATTYAEYADETLTHHQTAERLTELGYDRATAEAMVAGYLDDTSREIGVSVHRWGLDQHDVDAIAAQHQHAAVPAQRTAESEQERRGRLARWHADDQSLADDTADGTAAVQER